MECDKNVVVPNAGAPVIGPAAPHDTHKKCLVLDLDETLVHSSFKPVPNPDFIIPVEIEDKVVEVYVLKRPYMDQFMAEVGARFEVVVFTASLSKYADPLLDLLDIGHVVRWRLFRWVSSHTCQVGRSAHSAHLWSNLLYAA